MFWRMNTETYYEVSKFALISKCELGEGEGESLTNPKSGRKLYALILTLKHCSREFTQDRNAS